MTKLLLAKDVVENAIPRLNNKCLHLTEQGLKPKMCVVLVGQNPASLVYIRNKKKLCEKVGAGFQLIELAEDVSESDFLETISIMNNDQSITGCFVQLPIPKHLQHIDVTELIAPQKDVDGFHGESILGIYKNTQDGFTPCTPKGILNLLNHYQIEVEGKHVVVIGRSLIVGKPISLLLNSKNATVTMCHSKTKDLTTFTKMADIVISAIGVPRFLNRTHIRHDKTQVLIDVGINKDSQNKICGDIDFESVNGLVKALTPVPGGIGPLTVLSLIENLTIATENILQNRK